MTLIRQHKALQASGVFACCCRIFIDRVEVGVLIVDADAFEQINGQRIRLYNPDGDGDYTVHLPRLNAFATTQLSLPRYDQTPLV